ncbi:DUF6093 family protein [Cellulomonas rhizosphaerae]|uniref:Uncharacterized protein n=1 Tax=Cellulomonas rhizosphaerae TaxID=2293719 RepID=A0A413RJM4_9CELL|nr:DUF6093 family protein [Cellulomonas rhizosphaerae]RHA38736.1 hypothetical protein D1825_13465 [Cellulomonas rhizosphaerae]
MPFPSTTVIHPDWAAHHAGVAEGGMNATCSITHGGTGGDWDPELGATPGTPTVTYTGRCSVDYAATQARDADAADQTITSRSVLVGLPRSAAAQANGARVKITAVDGNGPHALVGRVLTVGSVAADSLTFEQLLECTDDQANQPEV